jgi:hypothetical protein
MISLLRWVAALPIAVLAAFVAHYILYLTFSTTHGQEAVDMFWESRDMAGMPISGTYMLLVSRAVTTGTLVGVAAWVAPQFKKQIGFSLAIIVSILSITFLIYLLYLSVRHEFPLGFGGWYRGLLELAGIILGCSAGVGFSSSMESRNGHV